MTREQAKQKAEKILDELNDRSIHTYDLDSAIIDEIIEALADIILE